MVHRVFSDKTCLSLGFAVPVKIGTFQFLPLFSLCYKKIQQLPYLPTFCWYETGTILALADRSVAYSANQDIILPFVANIVAVGLL